MKAEINRRQALNLILNAAGAALTATALSCNGNFLGGQDASTSPKEGNPPSEQHPSQSNKVGIQIRDTTILLGTPLVTRRTTFKEGDIELPTTTAPNLNYVRDEAEGSISQLNAKLSVALGLGGDMQSGKMQPILKASHPAATQNGVEGIKDPISASIMAPFAPRVVTSSDKKKNVVLTGDLLLPGAIIRIPTELEQSQFDEDGRVWNIECISSSTGMTAIIKIHENDLPIAMISIYYPKSVEEILSKEDGGQSLKQNEFLAQGYEDGGTVLCSFTVNREAIPIVDERITNMIKAAANMHPDRKNRKLRYEASSITDFSTITQGSSTQSGMEVKTNIQGEQNMQGTGGGVSIPPAAIGLFSGMGEIKMRATSQISPITANFSSKTDPFPQVFIVGEIRLK